MKSLGVFLSIVLGLSTVVFAQSEMHNLAKASAPGNAQASFDEMKTLAGEWEGPVTLTPAQPEMSDGKPLRVTMRVTSRGNAVVHEMQEAGTPPDPTKYDHPVTMFYLDEGHLDLVHYCDAGNRPHMVARPSPNNKKVEFDFVRLSGSNQNGHMEHAVFNIIDADHHTEDWTYLMPGDKAMHAHFDLTRVK
jgi:hypothetical protein